MLIHYQVIVWDEHLIGQVGLIADVLFLKELGVHKMVRLPTPQLTEEYKDLNEFYFFIRPKICFVEQIMEAIRYVVYFKGQSSCIDVHVHVFYYY